MTTDSIRATAVTRRAALMSEVARLDAFLATYDELAKVAAVHTTAAVSVPRPAVSFVNEPGVHITAAGDGGPSSTNRHARGWKTHETESFAGRVVKELGPQQTANLMAELERRGHYVGGMDPKATLLSRLGRAQSLEYDKIDGWRLKREPRQTNETAGSELHPTPAASGRDPDQPEGSSPYRAPVNPGGGGGI